MKLFVLIPDRLKLDDNRISLFESYWVQYPGRIAMAADSDEELAFVPKYFEKKLAVAPNEFDRFRLAILYAYLDQDSKYQTTCEKMIEAFPCTSKIFPWLVLFH